MYKYDIWLLHGGWTIVRLTWAYLTNCLLKYDHNILRRQVDNCPPSMELSFLLKSWSGCFIEDGQLSTLLGLCLHDLARIVLTIESNADNNSWKKCIICKYWDLLHLLLSGKLHLLFKWLLREFTAFNGFRIWPTLWW